MATSGARPAASLALRTADGCAGAQAISSGASSADSVSQVSVPATCPARKVITAAPNGSARLACWPALRSTRKVAGSR